MKLSLFFLVAAIGLFSEFAFAGNRCGGTLIFKPGYKQSQVPIADCGACTPDQCANIVKSKANPQCRSLNAEEYYGEWLHSVPTDNPMSGTDKVTSGRIQDTKCQSTSISPARPPIVREPPVRLPPRRVPVTK